jgi:RNA polymerase sigma-70 factor, ECF subfamily
MRAVREVRCERDVRDAHARDLPASFATMTLHPFAGRHGPPFSTQNGGAKSMMSEAELRLTALLARSINGDKRAYQRFLEELARHLRARLRKRLHRQDADIEDLVQEILLAVHKGLDTFRPEVPLTAWISAIVRYKLADHFRSVMRDGALFEPLDDAAESGAEAPSQIDTFEARRDLQHLLATLPPRQRGLIEHMKLLGLSVAETAAAMGLSESAEKVGVHRGLKALLAAPLNRP